ncbi:MAG: nonstructural protein [Microviridae sp.]|nr:MAG: nonstructural protein [Microviridae sp.]
MIKFLYTVYDSKARTYSNPFTAVNQQVAIRDFTQAANDINSQIHQFPGDFKLLEIGEFDDESCVMNLHPEPLPLGLAHNYLESERNYDVRS